MTAHTDLNARLGGALTRHPQAVMTILRAAMACSRDAGPAERGHWGWLAETLIRELDPEGHALEQLAADVDFCREHGDSPREMLMFYTCVLILPERPTPEDWAAREAVLSRLQSPG